MISSPEEINLKFFWELGNVNWFMVTRDSEETAQRLGCLSHSTSNEPWDWIKSNDLISKRLQFLEVILLPIMQKLLTFFSKIIPGILDVSTTG